MWASVRRYPANPELAERLATRSDEIKSLISGVPGLVASLLFRLGPRAPALESPLADEANGN